MARITVEDCLEKVTNRFHLVRVASKRARQIMNGKEPTLEWDNDKATVLALREIAAGNITEEMLDEKLINQISKLVRREFKLIFSKRPIVNVHVNRV